MTDIVDRIGKSFKRIEQWDLRVGDIWLHPKQVAELKGEPQYDAVHSRVVRDAFIDLKGAPYVGMIYGARVFESEIVVENHIVLVPDGLDAKLVDSAACMPL